MSASNLQAAIAQVRNTAQMVQLMLEGISPEDLAWKPSPSRFSIAEVLAHLAHVDEYCFGLRVQRVLAEDTPALSEYEDAGFLNQGAAFVSDGPARLASFVETRSRWIPVVASVDTAHAGRTGAHSKLGSLTAAQLVHEWAFHDLGHIRQIAEILRARCHYPEIGPFQSMYHVRP